MDSLFDELALQVISEIADEIILIYGQPSYQAAKI